MATKRKVLLGILGVLTGLLFLNMIFPLHAKKTSVEQTTIQSVTVEQRVQTDFEYDEVLQRRFDVEAGQALWLDTDLGKVQVRGDGGNEVLVTVIKGINGLSEREAEALLAEFDVQFRQTERGVLIEGEYDGDDRRRRRRRGRSLQVSYEIHVPSTFDVHVSTSGGSVSAEDLRGEAELRTSGGSVSAVAIDGPMTVHTSGGSISAKNIGGETLLRTSGGSIAAEAVQGSVDAHTSGGSISAENIGGYVKARTSGGGIRLSEIHGSVDAQTSGGSIRAAIVGQPESPVRLRTSGGSLTLSLDADVRANIEAHASGGRVRSDLPVATQGEMQRGHLTGELNGGGPTFSLRTSGGSIRINRQ